MAALPRELRPAVSSRRASASWPSRACSAPRPPCDRHAGVHRHPAVTQPKHQRHL